MRRRAKIIRFPATPSGSPEDGSLTEVHRCDGAEAVVVKSLFESEGIPTLLRSRVSHAVHPFTVGSQGEVAILVPPGAAPHSRRLLIRLARTRPS